MSNGTILLFAEAVVSCAVNDVIAISWYSAGGVFVSYVPQSSSGNITLDACVGSGATYTFDPTKFSVVANVVDLTGAFGSTNVITTGFFGAGATPRATTGNFRVGNAAAIIVARNAANTGDFTVLSTNSGDDTLITSGAVIHFVPQGTASSYAHPGGLSVVDGCSFGLSNGSVASVGDIRAKNNTTIIAARNAANTGNFTVLSTNAGNDTLITSGAVIHLVPQGTASAYAHPGGFTLVDGCYFSVSNGTVASVGDIRAKSNTTIVAARNAANTANVTALATDASDNVLVGGYKLTKNRATRTTLSAAIANTETQVIGATVEANGLKVGDVLRFRVSGVTTNSTTATTTLWRVRIGAATLGGAIVASNSQAMGTTARTSAPFIVQAEVTILSVGAAGTALGQAVVSVHWPALQATPTTLTAAVTIDTTASRVCELTCQSGGATTSWTAHTGTFEQIRA